MLTEKLNTKVLHHDKIQKAGSVIEAAKTPTTDPKVTTDPTPHREPYSVVHVEIPHVATSTLLLLIFRLFLTL